MGVNDFNDGYATWADFCRVFEGEMNCLYLLAFLLIPNRNFAAACFLRVLQAAQCGPRVFRPCVSSWIRRRIIKDALHTFVDQSKRVEHVRDVWFEQSNVRAHVNAVTQIDAFERFVFVLMVLEGYSCKECSLLLDCSMASVREARLRALRELGLQHNGVVAHAHELQASA